METPLTCNVDDEENLAEYSREEQAENDDHDNPLYCTFAVTGNQPSFQAIFVCNECLVQEEKTVVATATAKQQRQSSAPAAPLCICQTCADVCHNDYEERHYHDVDYIGMGPSTCDCNHMGGCKLYQKSVKEAERLRVVQKQKRSQPTSTEELGMIKDVYEVPFLKDPTITNTLVQYAQELIQHSKETFWVDQGLVDSGKNLCPLESLAWSIYQRHREIYQDNLHIEDTNVMGGAEWWVQVKPIDAPSSPSCGIDLHYDKDEALAESFGLGSFPSLSTVTYFTNPSPQSPPTVVLDHVYTQGEEEVMSQLLISRPRLGKHLVFDGRLLHGAPYHPKLQPISSDAAPNNGNSIEKSSLEAKLRVTFLVNIWKHRRPANVEILCDTIRHSILDVKTDTVCDIPSTPQLEMNPLTIPTTEVNNEEDLPADLQQRVELPFVSDKGAISAENNDDDEDSVLVVVTFPPPPTQDSILVQFGPGMQAYLERVQDQGDDDENKKGDEELLLPQQQSDYV